MSSSNDPDPLGSNPPDPLGSNPVMGPYNETLSTIGEPSSNRQDSVASNRPDSAASLRVIPRDPRITGPQRLMENCKWSRYHALSDDHEPPVGIQRRLSFLRNRRGSLPFPPELNTGFMTGYLDQAINAANCAVAVLVEAFTVALPASDPSISGTQKANYEGGRYSGVLLDDNFVICCVPFYTENLLDTRARAREFLSTINKHIKVTRFKPGSKDTEIKQAAEIVDADFESDICMIRLTDLASTTWDSLEFGQVASLTPVLVSMMARPGPIFAAGYSEPHMRANPPALELPLYANKIMDFELSGGLSGTAEISRYHILLEKYGQNRTPDDRDYKNSTPTFDEIYQADTRAIALGEYVSDEERANPIQRLVEKFRSKLNLKSRKNADQDEPETPLPQNEPTGPELTEATEGEYKTKLIWRAPVTVSGYHGLLGSMIGHPVNKRNNSIPSPGKAQLVGILVGTETWEGKNYMHCFTDKGVKWINRVGIDCRVPREEKEEAKKERRDREVLVLAGRLFGKKISTLPHVF